MIILIIVIALGPGWKMCIPPRVLDIVIITYQAHRLIVSTGFVDEEREMSFINSLSKVITHGPHTTTQDELSRLGGSLASECPASDSNSVRSHLGKWLNILILDSKAGK